MSDEIFSGAAIFSRYFSSSPLHKILYFFFALAFSVLLIRQIIHCDAVQPLFQDVTPIQIETFFQGILQHGVCVCVWVCVRARWQQKEKRRKNPVYFNRSPSQKYIQMYILAFRQPEPDYILERAKTEWHDFIWHGMAQSIHCVHIHSLLLILKYCSTPGAPTYPNDWNKLTYTSEQKLRRTRGCGGGREEEIS